MCQIISDLIQKYYSIYNGKELLENICLEKNLLNLFNPITAYSAQIIASLA
jgi:hypothetical protein